LGIIILLSFSWVVSTNRRAINWRTVSWGVILQLLFACFLFLIPAGTKLFLIINDLVIKILNSATAGSKFVFGRLALAPGEKGPQGETSLGFILAFQAFPTIIFFSSLMSILYYLNILPVIIRFFSKVFSSAMKISGAESLAAASNIFVGIESAFTIRPYLRDMTSSELCTVLTAGMATVASNVLALYVFTLRQQFPNIAGHLISASILSAPAAVVISKILYPETEKPVTLGKNVTPYYEKENSLFEAIINGAQAGVKVIVGIVALLIAILGLVSLCDLFLGFIGSKLNLIFDIQFNWSLSNMLGYLFYPFSLILGIPLSDCALAAKIIGERLILTEVASYQHLATAMAQGLFTSPRSGVIIAYALCGFSHIASMAIFVGGISALIPQRINDIIRVSWRALLGATLACLLTACVAGTFLSREVIIFGN
jgi:CNT family concentrative nucleoside transporter